jgi:HSP20 family protein
VLTADMPGFSKDDIEINLTDDSIELQAVRRQSREEQDKERKYIRRERASEIYYRQIGLPEQIRSNEAKATLKDGILQVILPKKAPKRKTKLEII